MSTKLLWAASCLATFAVGLGSVRAQSAPQNDNTASVTMRANYYVPPAAKPSDFSDPTDATPDSILRDLSDPTSPLEAPPVTPAVPAAKIASAGAPQKLAQPAALQPQPAAPECCQASPNDAAQQPAAAAEALGPISAACASCNLGCGAPSCCNASGCDDSCDCCCNPWPCCENCPYGNLTLFAGFDSWRGPSELNWPNNDGARFGFNYGTSGGFLRENGIGLQIGASYGVYDWSGRSTSNNTTDIQQQIFITTGFFVKADAQSPWSAGIVYDFMINNNFGVLANDGTLGQWRGQLGYAFDPCNELGVWGAARDRGMNQDIGQATARFRAVDQLNFFWHHKFQEGADTRLWVGLPDHTRLEGDGSLGDYILGASATVPMSDRWALYADAEYMHPSASPGVGGSSEETWNVSVGVVFYPRCNARSSTVSGSCWSPLMNVANNGTFLVDSNLRVPN